MHIAFCRICQQAIVNVGRGGACPYCGSPSAFLGTADDPLPRLDPLTEVERAAFEEAIGAEAQLARLVRGAAGGTEGRPRELLARLAVVAVTRVAVLCRLVALSLPTDVREAQPGATADLLDQAIELVSGFNALYSRAADGATSEQVREIAQALGVSSEGIGEAIREARWMTSQTR